MGSFCSVLKGENGFFLSKGKAQTPENPQPEMGGDRYDCKWCAKNHYIFGDKTGQVFCRLVPPLQTQAAESPNAACGIAHRRTRGLPSPHAEIANAAACVLRFRMWLFLRPLQRRKNCASRLARS